MMTIIVRWVLADGSFSAAGGISIRLWTNCSRPAMMARTLTPSVKTAERQVEEDLRLADVDPEHDGVDARQRPCRRRR